VIQQQLVFGGGANAALGGQAHLGRTLGHRFTQLLERLLVDLEERGDQLVLLLPELLENRAHQQAGGGEGVAAAIEAAFDPVLADPEALFGQEFALGQGR